MPTETHIVFPLKLAGRDYRFANCQTKTHHRPFLSHLGATRLQAAPTANRFEVRKTNPGLPNGRQGTKLDRKDNVRRDARLWCSRVADLLRRLPVQP